MGNPLLAAGRQLRHGDRPVMARTLQIGRQLLGHRLGLRTRQIADDGEVALGAV
jgi:hypothetical protein